MSEEITAESICLEHFGRIKWRATERNFLTGKPSYPYTYRHRAVFDSLEELLAPLEGYRIEQQPCGSVYMLYDGSEERPHYSVTVESFKDLGP